MNVQGIKSFFQKPEFGLFIIRVGQGILFAVFGFHKFAAGEGRLRGVGSAIEAIGINISSGSVLALIFGIMAAGAELIGGSLMVLGWMFRPAVGFLLFTMVVAVMSEYSGGFSSFGFPLAMGIVLLGLLFTGPGRMSIQKD